MRNSGWMVLPNPEASWTSAMPQRPLDRADVTRRIGPTRESISLLSGGLANASIRVGSDRVLRIYQRDPSALAKEARLLAQAWRHFRVPAVLDRGADFLVLEYVPHTPRVADCGLEIGRALAEVHAIRYDCAGLLDADLALTQPMPDFADSIDRYLCAETTVDAELCTAVRACLARQRSILTAMAHDAVLLHGDFKASNIHRADSGEILVLDWEFAYAGPALMDIGQLFRWPPPPTFERDFVRGYEEGTALPSNWRDLASLFDLGNLMGLLARAQAGSRRAADVTGRIRQILAELD